MINSVHEPGPNGDSEPIPSRKTRSKPSQVHEHQNWPNWAPRCARAWSYRGRAWPCRGRGPRPYRSARLSCRSVALTPLRAVSRAPCPAPWRRVAGAPAPYRGCSAARQRRVLGVCERRHGRIAGSRPRAWPAVSWAGCVVLQHNPAFPSQACHDTICLYCDTGFLTGPSAYCNTIHCIAIQFSSSPKSLCHDTLGFYNTTLSKSTAIQSKSTQAPITIQNIVLQYKQLSYLLQYNCKAFNTNSQYNWAVAQKRLCTVFFVFLLFYFFFFYFQQLENYKIIYIYIYIPIFFSFSIIPK